MRVQIAKEKNNHYILLENELSATVIGPESSLREMAGCRRSRVKSGCADGQV